MFQSKQNHAYLFGAKKANAKEERCISAEKLKEARELVKKYRTAGEKSSPGKAE